MRPLMLMVFYILHYSAEINANQSQDDLIIMTRQGKVRGIRYHMPNIGKTVDAFLGIPFAKPPVGSLRFEHPHPVDPWNGIYNATKQQKSCYQSEDSFFGDFKGSTMWKPTGKMSEDCLYLNVWVPRTTPRLNDAAVLVWIHGGEFFSGSPSLNIYDGKYLAALNNVIVVSISYRVGALGFLHLGNPTAPGNAGMFDQVMALEWVQRNIRHFGGGPGNVTIFGGDAGAASVSLHLMSPLSQTKFQRAIMQSGTANMPWSTVTLQEAKRRSLTLAIDYFDCDTPDDLEIIAECMRRVPVDKLVNNQWVTRGIMQFPFLPAVDGVFLPDDPVKLLNQGRFKKCPILLGSNLNEGTFFLIYELYDYLDLQTTTMSKDQFKKSIDILFHYYPQYPMQSNPFGLDAINFQYSNPTNPEDRNSNIAALDNAISDLYFTCNVNYFQQHYTRAGQNVFAYQFTQRTQSNPWPEWMGVLHGDEIQYVFGEPFKPLANYTEEEKELSQDIMKYWTNFAKTGDPNIVPDEWPIYTSQSKEYLELSQNSSVRRALRAKECSFWKEYLPKLVRKTAGLLTRPTSAPCPTLPEASSANINSS